jgi:cytochrome c biogenesis protein CcmG, thiol:disulfide interchange protein DsbE
MTLLRFGPILPVIALGMVFVFGLRENPNQLESVFIGKTPPSFSLPTLEPYQAQWGPSLGVQNPEKRTIVLNIWASWCIPCRSEAPLIAQYAKQYPQILFLGVNIQDTKPAALEFIRQYSLGFPSVFDPSGRVGIEYGYYGVPETFIIAGGKVVARHVGELKSGQLEQYLEKQ